MIAWFQVRILITTREKVSENPGEKNLFAQYHLMPLALEDGVDLLKVCSGMVRCGFFDFITA